MNFQFYGDKKVNYQNSDLEILDITNTNIFDLQDVNSRFKTVQDYINGTRNKIKHFQEFTYVVDSPETLLDWTHNVAENDYTSVLIKSGTYTINKGLNLTNSRTRVVVGESNAVLVIKKQDTDINTTFGYAENPNSPDYYINGITIDISTTYRPFAFRNCINLSNCKVIGASGNYGNVGFVNCSNLYNCYSIVGDYAYQSCTNLINCSGKTNNSGGATYGNVFKGCKSLLNCTATESNFSFENCRSVRYCTGIFFSRSYSSPTDVSGYACANTLEGGWNTTVALPE